ncbi:uncharacterized protein LOC142219918 [Haematobia irritans]|uniref:uncharacterized protein LOC142219918 n=1 Tax=Haematobia irritans TaxID=7368 RepID=UPI003F4F5D04
MKVIKNIFREYNIPCTEAKKKRTPLKRISHKSCSKIRVEEESIDNNFSDDEDDNVTKDFSHIQKRRSFEIPLKLVQIPKKCQGVNSTKFSNSYQNDEDSDDDIMPLPMIIKEEILSQPSEELIFSSTSSLMSSVNSSIPRLRTKVSSDDSSLSSGSNNEMSIAKIKSLALNHTVHLKRTRKQFMDRYKPLQITITKINSASKKSKMKDTVKKKPKAKMTKHTKSNLDVSCLSFQSISEKTSLVCSSPNPSQVISTPATPSPRKKPAEMHLMLDLIEKENTIRHSSITKSPKKIPKRLLQGGLVEIYKRAMDKAKADAKFLKHDKKFGLRDGLTLRILRIESAHGVHIAKVQPEDQEPKKTFCIILPNQTASHFKVNSKVEAFFDEFTRPYIFQSEDIFLKPNNLLLL